MANFPKILNPPAGGNSFSENFGKTLFLNCETPKFDWPCQSLFQKTFGFFFLGGGRKRVISPKNQNPPAGGNYFSIFLKQFV